MIRIGVVEDDPAGVDRLLGTSTCSSTDHGESLRISRFADGADLLHDYSAGLGRAAPGHPDGAGRRHDDGAADQGGRSRGPDRLRDELASTPSAGTASMR